MSDQPDRNESSDPLSGESSAGAASGPTSSSLRGSSAAESVAGKQGPHRPEPVTIRTLRHWRRDGKRFAMLTCYDATTARWLSRAGVPMLLVGDSAGQIVLGHKGTTQTPLDFLILITAAVKRSAPDCFVMADMPFLSYQIDDTEALRNAGRFLTEANADAVKLEIDESYAPLVSRMARAGIPTVAHIGWRPQRHMATGVPVVAGRTREKIAQLVATAQSLEQAGAAMLLIEQSTAEASQAVVDAVSVPVIGCGAGPACHGEVVILHDWLGLTDWQPSFVTPIQSGGQQLIDAARAYVDRVAQGQPLTGDEHPYHVNPGQER